MVPRKNNPKRSITTTRPKSWNNNPEPGDEPKPQVMIGGIGQEKHALDDPDDELLVREPRIINPIPANTIMNASIGIRWEVLQVASKGGLSTERLWQSLHKRPD